MYIPRIKDDDEFREEILSLKEYFDNVITRSTACKGIREAYYPLKFVYKVVFEIDILRKTQDYLMIYWPVKEHPDGKTFLSSPEGKRFLNVMYYFKHKYKIPEHHDALVVR